MWPTFKNFLFSWKFLLRLPSLGSASNLSPRRGGTRLRDALEGHMRRRPGTFQQTEVFFSPAFSICVQHPDWDFVNVVSSGKWKTTNGSFLETKHSGTFD